MVNLRVEVGSGEHFTVLLFVRGRFVARVAVVVVSVEIVKIPAAGSTRSTTLCCGAIHGVDFKVDSLGSGDNRNSGDCKFHHRF